MAGHRKNLRPCGHPTRRDGTPCQVKIEPWEVTCHFHGGTLPNVKRAADKRLLWMALELANPTMAEVAHSEQVRRRAVIERNFRDAASARWGDGWGDGWKDGVGDV